MKDDDTLFASLTNGTGAPTAELTIENLLEAQRRMEERLLEQAIDIVHPDELAAREAGIHWMVNELVPLERTEADGSKTAVLCWRIEGSIHVHPDRVLHWRAMLATAVVRGELEKLRLELGLPEPGRAQPDIPLGVRPWDGPAWPWDDSLPANGQPKPESGSFGPGSDSRSKSRG